MSNLTAAQHEINRECIVIYNAAMTEYNAYSDSIIKPFLHCSAETIVTENYIFLRSYNTIVAVYDKISSVLVDVLRYVYGYTATSNQHICKFYKYVSFNYFCSMFLRYKE